MVRGLAFSRDGKWLVSGGADNVIKVWDTQSGAEISSIRFNAKASAPPETIEALALSPDSMRVAAAGESGEVKVWEVSSGLEVAGKDGRDATALKVLGHAYDVAFSNDGKRYASANFDDLLAQGFVRIVDADTGKVLKTFSGFKTEVTGVAFNSDASLVAASLFIGAVVVLDATGQAQLKTLNHGATITRVAFSPDGSLLATAGFDGSGKLWNTSTWREKSTRIKHKGPIWAVAFSPNGKLLATGANDKTVRLWDVSTGTEVRALVIN
jgi:WD40 repeat protein